MNITKVIVKNYRSFGDESNMLHINQGVTTIVGMNGSGKSNLVDIIGKVDLTVGINGANQLSSQRNKIKQGKIALEFTLESLSNQSPTIVGSEPTVITFGENDLYEIKGGVAAALSNVYSSYDILNAFQQGKYPSSSDQTTVLNEVRSLSNYCKIPLAAYIRRITTIQQRLAYLPEEIRMEAQTYLEKLLSHVSTVIASIPFIYYQKESRTLKDRYTLAQVRPYSSNNKDSIDQNSNDLLLSLLKVAQIDRKALEEAIANPASSTRESFERTANRKIENNVTQKFKAKYKKNSEDLRMEIRLESNCVNIHVSVGDVVTSFTERSNGLRWYLNMFIDLMSQIENQQRPVVYVLDEPGIFLHVNAQSELRSLFQEQAASGTQIIYTTHSPYMIDPKCASLRAITKLGDSEFSSIQNSLHSPVFHNGTSLDTLTPIANSLGMNFKLSFGPSQDKLNVITEGVTDQIYLLSMAEYLQLSLDQLCFIPSTGANNVKHLCSILLGWGFNFIALFDFDSKGRECANELQKELNLSIGKNIIFLKDIDPDEFKKITSISSADAITIERLISEADRNAYNIEVYAQQEKKKIAALKFSNGISHEGYSVSDETKSSFNTLFSRIMALI